MNKQNGKRLLCCLLCAALVCCLACCKSEKKKAATVEPMAPETVNTLSYDFLGGEDVMPIAGYYGPMPSHYSYNGQSMPDTITDKYFKLIAESGINLISHTYTDYATAPALTKKMLELGEKYGVGIYVYDSVVAAPFGDTTASLEKYSERINQYCNYPAFCGMYVADEPTWSPYLAGDGSRDISKYAPVFDRMNALGVNAYANMVNVNSPEKMQGFKDYIDAFVDAFHPNYLSFDQYPYRNNAAAKDGYMMSLSCIRDKALECDLPFWSFVQAGGQWNDNQEYFDSIELYPNEKQTHWCVNTALAYGAQGIDYFLIFEPYYFGYASSKPFDFERNGMFGTWGNINRWYYYIQNINRHIAACDEVLMHCKTKGVLVKGKQVKLDNAASNAVIEGTSWRELTGFEGDEVMIGCFNYNGKTALYVVNYDDTYAQKITLRFADEYRIAVTKKAETSRYSCDSIQLDMQGGEGVLVVFE